MRGRHVPSSAALLTALAVAGCGITNPYATRTNTTASRGATRTAPAVTSADPAPERGGTIPRTEQRRQSLLGLGAGETTPQAALERYAQLYTNWTASTVASDQRQLAAISLDSARAQALQAASDYGRDETQRASHVTNHGAVIAIARGQGAAADDWVVVTRETTTGSGDYAGLPPQLHITYAQLTRTRDGWVVSTWSPQT